tara:strand:+ start:175 stop:339 length:165 start_codon:yes stop_codon:yes gene_type:complete
MNIELINEITPIRRAIKKITLRDRKNNWPEKIQNRGFFLNFSKKVFCSMVLLID